MLLLTSMVMAVDYDSGCECSVKATKALASGDNYFVFKYGKKDCDPCEELCCALVGSLYLTGTEVKANPEIGIRYTIKGCALGNRLACESKQALYDVVSAKCRKGESHWCEIQK